MPNKFAGILAALDEQSSAINDGLSAVSDALKELAESETEIVRGPDGKVSGARRKTRKQQT